MTPALGVLLAALLFIACAFVRTRRKAARLSSLDWNALLGTLKPLPMFQIRQIALEYLEPGGEHYRADSQELWHLIGGAEGLSSMYSNAEVLIALASYATQWNPHETYLVIERMRRDAVVLRRATLKLSVGLTLGVHRPRGPLFVQEAASAYYTMRQRIMALYEVSNVNCHRELRSHL